MALTAVGDRAVIGASESVFTYNVDEGNWSLTSTMRAGSADRVSVAIAHHSSTAIMLDMQNGVANAGCFVKVF